MHPILLSGMLTLAAPAADDSLRGAVQRGDVERVKEYVAARADLNRLVVVPGPPFGLKNALFMTEGEAMLQHQMREHNAHVELPLTLAITLGRKEIIKLLLEAGADPGKAMTNGRTAVHAAVRIADRETLKLLIGRKAPLDTPDLQGVTPLLLAGGQSGLAPVLLEAGADPNLAGREGRTALHQAVEANDGETLALLLKHKADPNVADKQGDSPLHLAVKRRYQPLVEKLLAAGARADTTDGTGRTALMSALWAGDCDLAQRLLDAGARVDTRDPKRQTPLHALVGFPPAVRFLLARKADLNARDEQGRTPLHVAVEASRNWGKPMESVVSLLRHRADQGLKDTKGRTPFDLAVEMKSYRLCRILALHSSKPPEVDPLKLWDETSTERKHYLEIKKGLEDGTLKPDSLNPNGVPLLTAAVGAGEDALTELLIARKADLNVKVKDGSTPLYHAALSDSWLGVKLLLDAGADSKDSGGAFGPLLQMVVEEGNVEIARLLLEKGINPNDSSSYRYQVKMTPLHLAILQGSTALTRIKPTDPSMAELLLEHKADPNARGWYGDVPAAHLAFEQKRWLIFERLLAHKGLDVSLGSDSGVTLLHLAAEKGDLKLIKRLLALGADVNAVERKEYSPLYWAVAHSQLEAAKLLIEHGARVSVKVKRDGREYDVNVLHVAAGIRSPQGVEIVELLLKQGADVKARDGQGRTPLHCAAEHSGDAGMIRLLLKNGADVNARQDSPNTGATPLYYACSRGHVEAVQALLEAGADMKLTADPGYTPLYTACCVGSTPVVRLLLEKGADPNVASPTYRERPLHQAVLLDNTDMVALLLKHKADPRARDSQGKTPLDYARGRGKKEILELLER